MNGWGNLVSGSKVKSMLEEIQRRSHESSLSTKFKMEGNRALLDEELVRVEAMSAVINSEAGTRNSLTPTTHAKLTTHTELVVIVTGITFDDDGYGETEKRYLRSTLTNFANHSYLTRPIISQFIINNW